MDKDNIRNIVDKLTLEEKVSLLSGADFWNTAAVERLGIPSAAISDGPNGLRKQSGTGKMGLHESRPAVAFPAGSLTASSFDRKLMNLLGRTLGAECREADVDILLGPSMNIKRSPLGGRNQEYISEDPYLTGEMAGAFIDGLQEMGTIATPKHFFGNNMEERRLTTSSEIDERTQREIYLPAFEKIVKEHDVKAIMSSYNKLNGTYVSESRNILTDLLRDEWGFDGMVMSDWGAVNDRAADLKAGLDLEMPYSHGAGAKAVIDAVNDGSLDIETVDRAVERVLGVVLAKRGVKASSGSYDWEKDHQMARRIASESMVLLKNQNGILPLKKEQKIAFIGSYADAPRYVGGGSSHVVPYRVSSALEASSAFAKVSYAKGFDDSLGHTDASLLSEAVSLASLSDVAVLFIGLPDGAESEGFDRADMELPDYQNELVRAVASVQENTVVVLHGGAPVTMPWIYDVKAVIESFLAGEAIGEAQCDILFGAVNPSGHLAESFPLRLEDNPSYLNFRPVNGKVEYAEGVFVGYRYYETVGREVLFPFGHGLSYTTFSYSNLSADKDLMKAEVDELAVSVTVTNRGHLAGAVVVQLYISPAKAPVERPIRELRGFEKVYLEAGESSRVIFTLSRRDFAYWDVDRHDWFVPEGEYMLQIGRSADDIVLEKAVTIESPPASKPAITRDTAIGDLSDEQIEIVMEPFRRRDGGRTGDRSVKEKASSSLQLNMPLRSLVAFGAMDEASLSALLARLNGENDA